ncbi:unknown [Roseburia sp. CAG:380]|jgi:hypothetical protein|nr:unknown [Roseburia sp. CAG:380]
MKDQLEEIEKRLACIEENTRLLLLSDVMEELDKSTDILEDKLLSEWLEQQRMTMEKLDTVNGQRLVYLSFLEKVGLKRIRATGTEIIQKFEVVPVFVFDTLTTIQKRTLLNEKYSYIIRDREQHLFLS